MNPENTALTAYDEVQKELAPPKSANPLLCERCQAWDDVLNFEPLKGDNLRLVELSSNKDCLICRAIAAAVDARREESDSMHTWPASRIVVRNDGPYFLDAGHFDPDNPYRIDLSDPNQTAIRLLMKLAISFLDEAKSTDSIESTDKVDYTYGIGSIDDSQQVASSFYMTPQFCLRYSTGDHDSPHLSSIEPWEVPLFDISLLRTWLQGCEDVHSSNCVGNVHPQITELPPGFRIIDVSSLNVVKPAAPVRFVALSYMWQQSSDSGHVQLERGNLKELEVPGGLSNIPLPTIISDAMSLCRELGETYLWVDRLCIMQDDTDSKHDQIRGMDKIYRSATFAIIASLNNRDGNGLPGFWGRPRASSIWVPPRHCEFEGRGIRPNAMTTVDRSLWNMRGWTFQERVLSRRRLFITEFQVIFECSQGQAYEEFTYCPQRPYKPYDSAVPSSPESLEKERVEELESRYMPAFSKRSSYDGNINYNLENTITLVGYFDWVEDYTGRELSFRSDILNAFAGVGNYLGDSLGSHMIFGLPEKYIPQALMWSCLGLAERRVEVPQIPSWSWASSLTSTNYYWIMGRSTFKDHLIDIASLVYFHFQDPDTGLRKLDVEERWIEHEVNLVEFENQNEVPELTGKYIPGAWRSNQTWQECPHNPWKTLTNVALDPQACRVAAGIPGSLLFNTTVASLKLDPKSRVTDAESAERDVAICDQNGGRVGWLNKMSLDWIEAHQDKEKTYDFIVICGALENWRSRKTMAQYLKDYNMWLLHVMLIERLPFEPYVARRVDVGSISAHKWKDCSPRWETVVLC